MMVAFSFFLGKLIVKDLLFIEVDLRCKKWDTFGAIKYEKYDLVICIHMPWNARFEYTINKSFFLIYRKGVLHIWESMTT
jgi:hypothetical protein